MPYICYSSEETDLSEEWNTRKSLLKRVKDPSFFDIIETSGGGAAIRVKGTGPVGILELSLAPLISGLVALTFCAFRRRR